jgi:type I restriction enzyme S subunit
MEKQQSKKPLIRFPEFKDAWEHKRLNELLSEAKKRNEDLKYGKDEVLSVSGELGIVNQIEHLGRSYAGVSVHNYHVVEVGDIVYTKSPLKANPFGIIKLNKGKTGIVSTLYAVYKVNQQTAYGPFIDYYFSLDANTNRYLRPLVKKGAKNDMKINNAYVLHDRIFAPTIPEQKRIASFFTVLDKKITELKQKKNLLEQYKKGIMQKLFSQELRYKDENGKEFPKWEKKKLGEIGTFQTSSIDKLSKENEKEVFLINYMNVYRHENINNKSIKTFQIVTAKDNQIESCSLKKGDILFTPSSETPDDIGHSVVIFEDLNNAVFSYHLMRFRPNLEIDILYSHYFCNITDVLKQLTKLATGITRFTISVGSFSGVEINLPCLKEQSKIANFLSAIDDKINHTENQILQTEQYKKGLLQKMFI